MANKIEQELIEAGNRLVQLSSPNLALNLAKMDWLELVSRIESREGAASVGEGVLSQCDMQAYWRGYSDGVKATPPASTGINRCGNNDLSQNREVLSTAPPASAADEFKARLYEFLVPYWQGEDEGAGLLAARLMGMMCRGEFDSPTR